MSPFLDDFRARTEPAIVNRWVMFPSAAGQVRGYLARQDTREALPAVLLIHDEKGLTDWIKTSARELCSIGYVVLAVDLGKSVPPSGKSSGPVAALADEATLAKLTAAVRWLRRQPDVLPERIGVVGWSRGGDQALALAAATPVQACVACYGSLATDAALLGGLRTTPILVLVAGKDRSLPAFRKALEAARIRHKVRVFDGLSAGFMMSQSGKPQVHGPTEDAWVEIYNFLGRYVEDAPENGPGFSVERKVPQQPKSIARIADVMRIVNGPTMVRGSLIRALAKKPATAKEWKSIHSQAAVIAEAGIWLEQHQPPKGSVTDWLRQTRDFTATAREIVSAADRQDYAGARRALDNLGKHCVACHRQHR